jgi:flagellar export protein FliJ
MRPFKFRAEAALDLRRKYDEDARRALALARAATHTAGDVLSCALERIESSNRESAAAWQASGAIDRLIWQRNWMIALERDVDGARQALTDRESEERRAAEIAQHARMQVRVLERLRERALRAWQLEARRVEQKAIDELAGLRFAARQRAAEE